MKLTFDDNLASFVVTEYTTDYIRVNKDAHNNSIIVSHSGIVPEWPPQTLEQLAAEHIEQILKLGPEIILLGTGSKMQFPKPDILQVAYSKNIGIEVMDTAAACRTYNMLASDGRKVVAGLILN